ncbi:hypothetical protein [Methylorubrum sp. SL192]|uniref:hypothetical protein n=1 Tax=Methylorubrum sp. SL192 TaxID=2995167 RepID=UPI002274DFCC|nr:hypothetical protein [Methylorubrum sp. SL192]MCY1644604.1 hypothetical protein [Methylorubrum sp. SL192]
MIKSIFAIALAGLVALPSLAMASDYAFKLHNRAEGYSIAGFYTYQNGRWSRNWIGGSINPGQSASLDWNSNDGDCVVPFRVKWRDYGADDFKLDWCKGVSNVYMKDKGFTYD